MMAKSLSTLGAVAFLVNSFSPYSLFFVPFALSGGGLWLLVPIVLLSAWMSYLVSKAAVALTNQADHNRNDSGPTAQLLPSAASETEGEIASLPKSATGCCNSTTYLVAVYCCLMTVMDFGLVGGDSMGFILRPEERVVFLVIVAVGISVLNLMDFRDLEYLHIVLAACRVLWCIIYNFNFVSDAEVNRPVAFVPYLLTAFLYQIPLPAIARRYNRTESELSALQQWVVVGMLVVYGGLAVSITVGSRPTTGLNFSFMFQLLFFLSNFATAHLYWKSLADIVITAHFGPNIASARANHSLSIRLIETCLHLPVYGAYVYVMITMLPELIFGYAIRLLFWQPVCTLVLYWSVIFSYTWSMNHSDDSKTGKTWDMTLGKWLLGGLSVIGVVLFVLTLASTWMYIWAFMIPNFVGVVIAIAIAGWSRIGSR